MTNIYIELKGWAKAKTRFAVASLSLTLVFIMAMMTANAQLSGSKTIPGDYATIAAAVSDLNTLGVGAGGVTFTITGPYTETVPTGGLIIKQCALAAGLRSGPTQPVTFIRSGGSVTLTAAAGTGTFDGIVKIVGADNITFDGIDVIESASNTTTAQQMEMGYGIFKCNANDAAVAVTITNCSITLNKANTSTIAIRVAHTDELNVTSGTYSGTAGDGPSVAAARNRVSIINNTISNVYNAVSLAASPGSSGSLVLNDSANVVNGNTITNFGGGSVAVNLITAADNRYFSMSNNIINGGISTSGAITAINGGSGPGGIINGNTITIVSASITTAAVTGISYTSSGTGFTFSMNNNIVTGCKFTGATTAAFTGITSGNSGTGSVVTMNGNTVSNDTLAGTGTFIAIANSSTPITLSMNNNIVTGNFKSSTGTWTGLSYGGSTNATINNNSIQNNSMTGGAVACTFNAATGGTSIYTFDGNTIYNCSVTNMSGSSVATVSGFTNTASPTGETLTNNVFRKLTVGGTSTGIQVIRAINHNTTTTGNTRLVSNNIIDSLSTNAASSATITGIISSLGGAVTVTKNKITNLSGGGSGSTVTGISVTSGSTNNITNNLIGDLFASTSTGANAVIGISLTGGTSDNIYYNSIRLSGGGSGSAFGSSGISVTTGPSSVDLSNNLVVNLITPGGTGGTGGFSTALRRGSSALTNFASASNNNLYYSGTPGTNNIIFYDGSAAKSTLALYKATSGLSPREQSSITENVNFISTSPASSSYLHINTGIATGIESGAKLIAAVTVDYDNDARSGTSPDIGADEGTFILAQPQIASITASPAGVQCVAVARTISVNVNPGSNPVTSVTLNFAFNGVAQTAVTMTNTVGTTWTGTIPAATPVTATVAYTITATDGTYSPVSVGTSYADEPLTGITPTASAAPNPICSGSTVTLTGNSTKPGNVTIGTATTTTSTTSQPTAFCNRFEQYWAQMVYTAAELQAAGLRAGNITSITFTITSVGSASNVTNFIVSLAPIGTSTLTGFTTTGLTQVFGPATYNHAVGANTITFTTPYLWNGTSNILVDLKQGGVDLSSNAETFFTVTPGNTCASAVTSNTPPPDFTTTSPAATLNGQRLNIIFRGNTAPTFSSYKWNDGTSDFATTLVATANPTTNTTYAFTATDANGCSVSASVPVSVIALPATPTATNSAQCGSQIPSASVTGTGTPGNTFRWYSVSTGGTAIAGETLNHLTSTLVSATTTFYVAEYNGTCESIRVPVTVTVSSPVAIAATASVSSTCPFVNFTLDVTSTNDPNYTYTWNGTAGSGITTPLVGAHQTIQATAGGTFTYTVNAYDSTTQCATSNTAVVTVSTPPLISSATASPNTVCSGSTVTLTGLTLAAAPGTATIGTATTLTGDIEQPTAFCNRWEQYWCQLVYTAAELQASGMSAGPISALTFYINTIGSATNVFNFRVSLAPIGTTTLTGFTSTGLTQVYGPATYNQAIGANTITFSTPYMWDGTSNILVDLKQGGADITNNSQTYFTATTGNTVAYATTGSTPPPDFTTTSPAASLSNKRFNITFNAIVGALGAGSYTWQWSPGTIPAGNVATVNPTTGSTTTISTYTVEAHSSVTGCSNFVNVPVTVNPIPVVPAAHDSVQCGPGVPKAYVTNTGTGTNRWYLTASGGSPLAGESGTTLSAYSISATTTFYVSLFDGNCESPRTAVVENVVTGGSVTLTSTAPACLGSSITLTATDVSSYGYTSFTLSASPAGGSGLSPQSGVFTSPQTFTITPSSTGTYVYTFTASDGLCNSQGTATVIVGNIPVITSATASPSTSCSGSSVTLTGVTGSTGTGNSTIGTATTLTTSTEQPTAFCNRWPSYRMQLVYTASELSSTGLVAGPISAIAFRINTLGDAANNTNFEVKMGNTALSALSAFESTTGYTTVFPAATYNHVIGLNTINFSTPFVWNGTSNVVIELIHSGINSINNSETYYTATAGNTVGYTITNSSNAATLSAKRPNIIITGTTSTIGAGTYTWQWSPGTIPAGNTATVNPTVTGVNIYTVTATEPASGCTATANASVNVLALPASPSATPSSQCGFGIPTASVTGTPGTLRWYLVPTGGTALAGETGNTLTAYSINATTTFYVAASDGTCESARVPVVVTVTQPDAVTASASVVSGCSGNAFNLIATQTGSTNTYTYTWTASPSSGSGIATSVSGSPASVTPTNIGTYTYTVVAIDASASCATTSSVIITVNTSPIITVTPVTASVCPDVPVQLNAVQTNGGGLAFALNGTNQYLAIASSPSLNLSSTNSNSFTLEAWTKTTTAIFDGGIISKYMSSAGGPSYFLRQGSVSPYTGIGAGGNAEILSTPSTGVVTTGTWAHVAAVFSYNAATTNDSVKIYVNGVLKASGATTIPVNTDSIRIGSDFAGRYFTGQIDEVRIWNFALNGSTISNWMAQTVTAAHPNYANLVAYYNFDATVSGTVTDLSGNGNTAYVRNGATQVASTVPFANTTYSWSPTTGLSNPAIANPIATTSSNTVYMVTVTSPNGCSTTGSSSLTILPTAPAPTATPSTQCGIGVPAASVSGVGSNFNWYLVPTGGTALSGQHAVALSGYSISTTTTFYVSENNGTCDGPRTAVVATVNQPDAINIIANDSSICANTVLTLTANQTGSTNSYTYVWNGTPASGSGIPTTVSGNPASVTPTAGGTFVYHVVATDAAAGCATDATLSIAVTAPPFISSATANPTQVCPGSPSVLTGLANDYAPGLISIGGSGTSSIGGNDGNPYRSGNGGTNQIRTQMLVRASELTAAGLVPGNITSLAFTTSTGSTGTVSNFTISMGLTSVTDLTSTFETSPMTTVFTQASFTPASSGLNVHTFSTPFFWNGTSNIVINTCQANNVSGTATVVTSAPGFNSNTHLAGSTTSCSSLTGTVVGNNRPIMQFGGLTGASGPGTFTWQWSPGTIPAGNVATVNPTVTTTYHVTATDPATGCSSMDSATVTVINTTTLPTISTTPSALCGSGTTVLAVTNPVSGLTYSWQSSSTGTGSWSSAGTGVSIVSPTLSANTYFRAVATCGTASDTSLVSLVVVNNPVVVSGTGATRCGTGTVNLSVTGTGSFDWYLNSSGGTALITNTSTYSPTVSASTTYWVQAYIGTCLDANGRFPITVTVNAAPSISASATPIAICPGQSSTLNVTSSNANYSYVWNGSLNGALQIVSPSTTTVYNVVATDTTTGSASIGCASVATVTVTVNPAPTIASVTSSYSSICGTVPVQLGVTTSGSSTVTPLHEGFESYPVTSFDESGTGVTWANNTSLYTEGIASAHATYSNFSDGTLTMTTGINLSTIQNPRLTFSQIAALEGYLTTYDVGTVEYSIDGGSAWLTFPTSTYQGSGTLVTSTTYTTAGVNFSVKSYPDWTASLTGATAVPTSSMWKNETINLASLGASTDFRIRFRVTSDLSILYYGWLIDNVRITGDVNLTYAWTSTPAGFSSTSPSPVVTPTASANYNVVVTNGQGCTVSGSVPVAVLASPQPVLNYTADQTLCSSEELSFLVSDTTGTYSTGYPSGTLVDWGGLIFDQSPGTPIGSNSLTSFYAVVKFPGGGCTVSSDTTNVTVVTVDVATTSIPSSCSGGGGSITTTVTGVGPFHYVYKNSSNVIVRDTTGISSTDTYNNVATGTYTVTVTGNADGSNTTLPICSSAPSTILVTGTTPFTLTTSSTQETCPGLNDGSATVILAGGSGNFAITWTPGGGTTSTIGSLAPGLYSVTVLDTVSGCSNSANVTVAAAPVATFVPTILNVSCYGLTDGFINANFSASPIGVSAYEWVTDLVLLPPPPTYTQLGVSDGDLTGVGAGTYYIHLIDANSCEQFSGPITITQPALVSITSFTPANGTPGTSVVITGTGFTGTNSVLFNGVAATYTVNNATQITATVPALATTGTITINVGVCSATSTGIFTVDVPTFAVLNLKGFIEGYYLSGGLMNGVNFNIDGTSPSTEADSIIVELHDPLNPTAAIEPQTIMLNTDGTATMQFSSAILGGDYYVAVHGRNMVETWSHDAIHFTGVTTYDFTTASTQAFDDGINPPMKLVDGIWMFYSGDVNQDGTVDGSDMNFVEIDATNLEFGYQHSDITGDGASDGSDMNIIEINTGLLLFTAHP